MNKKLILLSLSALVALGGCTSTRMESYQDPQSLGRTYKKIIAFGNFDSIGQRQAAEDTLCKNLRDHNVACLEAIKQFPPTRAFNRSDIAVYASSNSYEAILEIKPNSNGETVSYVHEEPFTIPISKPYGTFKVILADMQDKKVAWTASPFSRGHSYEDLIHSIAEDTIDDLADKKLIPPKVIPKSTYISGPPRGY